MCVSWQVRLASGPTHDQLTERSRAASTRPPRPPATRSSSGILFSLSFYPDPGQDGRPSGPGPSAGRCAARQGLVWLGLAREAGYGLAWPGLARQDKARVVWSGMVRDGSARGDMARLARDGLAGNGWARLGPRGMARLGRYGKFCRI
jgi:hypothetical protein